MEILFVVEHTPFGDVLRTYQGMSQETITALVSEEGNTFDFITNDEYNTRVSVQPIAEPASEAVSAQAMPVENGTVLDDTASRLGALEARMAALEGSPK